jgi:enoyl-CoA hydratase/carnithine racemase
MRAEFGFPEIAYGMGGAGGMTRLGRHVPEAIAMEMLLLGKRISATRALDFHLINGIVEPERLLHEACAVAEHIASHPPIAVQLEMDAYRRAMDMTREQAMDYSGTLFRFQRVAYDGPGAGTGFFRKSKEIPA